MKILWLSHLIPYPPKGGVLQRSYQLVNELSKMHDVDLLAFNQKDLITPLFKDYNAGLSEAFSILSKCCRHVEFVDIECDKHKYGKHLLALQSLLSSDPYNVNWLKSSHFFEAAKILNAKKKYDIVHFDTISLLPYFRIFSNAPRVLDHHNIESHMLLRRVQNEKNIFKRMYYLQEGIRLRKVEKKYCPLFNLNMTCSKIDSERLKAIVPKVNVTDIPNGVDVEYFKSIHNQTVDNKLIFIGTLGWYPNSDAVKFIAEKLWHRLCLAIPGVSIDIIGSKPPQAISNASKKYPNFKVHGFVDDVRPYLDNAALYVCPIKDGGGTKLKLLDAFAMGKAVIAHPIACEGIDVQPDKNVVFATTPDEFYQKIINLLENKNLRDEIGNNARKLVERQYSYEVIGKRLCYEFEQCVKVTER